MNAALVAFFPLMVNTIVGLRSAEEDKVNLMRSLAASKWQIFWMLQLPNAMPYIFAGLEIAMILALIGAIVAELLGATAGLGMLIQSMKFTMDVAGQFSVLIILSVLGLILNGDGDWRAQARAVLGCLAEIQRRSGKQGSRVNDGRDTCERPVLLATAALLIGIATASAQTTVKVGWCARTVSSAAAPYAIATKIGWYKDAGIKVELMPLPGSTDCVKAVATKDVQYGVPSIEPVAIVRPQGVKIKNFYTAYQANIYGIAVPDDSPIRTFADLKGKKIGVTSMASAGVIVARALARSNGLDPDKDMTIVVAGEAAQTAALLRGKQVDALSQFDTQYALTENAGAKLRLLDTKDIAIFPSNGFIALEERLSNNRAEAVAVARGYAMGTVFAIANPEAAIRILWEVYPQTKATGKDEATAMRDDIKTLEARAKSWRLESVGAKKWGENLVQNYDAYVDFLVKNGVLKEKVPGTDLVTNDLIDDINKFDPAEIEKLAKGWKG